MALRMGLVGKKVGMTQVFLENGTWKAVTVVQAGPCVVLDKKTPARDGYSAVKIGFGEQKAHRISRPDLGMFNAAKTTPKRIVREIRLDDAELEQFSIGQTLSVDQVFRSGAVVDVTGVSRGKGFQGVMKRHHFAGFRATHGTHEYFRHGGSIGCRLTPGRVYKGRKMPGQMGNERVTVQNVLIHEVIPEDNLLLLQGAVPGVPGGFLTVRLATKRPNIPFKLIAAEPTTDGAEADSQAAPAA